MNSSLSNTEKVLLNVRNLDIGYNTGSGRYRILHSKINGEIKNGELIALLGPNGAGKSTLLKTLTGIIPLISGKVFFGNKIISHMSTKEIAREVSLVLTDKIDNRYLKAIDIVSTGRYPYGSFLGRLSDADQELIINSLRQVEAEELAQRYYYSLSDGEKQRVLLARAIAQDTSLIFLDEPAAFIDSPGKVQIMNLLLEIVNNCNRSILLTTHDTDLALKYATKLWLLGKDDTFISGQPAELINNGSVNKLFDRKGVSFNKISGRFEIDINKE